MSSAARRAAAASSRAALLALRTDPLLSIVSAAEYGTQNLADMTRDGVVPEGSSDDDRAHYMYIGHHEGSAGADPLHRLGQLYGRTSGDCARELQRGRALRKRYSTAREAYRAFAERFSRGKFPAQVGRRGRAIMQRCWERAYRAWLRDYADRKIQPDRFRER